MVGYNMQEYEFGLNLKYCSHCGDILEGMHFAMSSLEDADFGEEFFVCFNCVKTRYVFKGKVIES